MSTVIDHGNGLQSKIVLEDGNLIAGTIQDCTPILEYTQALHREGLHGSSEMKHAAKIPMVAIEQYMNLRGITYQEFMADEKHIRAMLNDPDLKGFRIWQGRV